MAYEQRDNSGSLFNNDRKETDRHPDRAGSAMIDGVEYWVNGWVKQDRHGRPWLSMAFKRKDQQGAGKAGVDNETAPAARQSRPKLDDDIPW